MSNSKQYLQPKATADTAGDIAGDKLKRQSFQSGLITFTAQPIKLAMGIGAASTLARLVTPEDFGLLAMVTPLLALVDSLSNMGMETATVQKQALNQQQASAAFWLSLKVNVAVLGAMVAMGPVLAWFYGRAALVWLTLAMAVGALSLCLSFQHKSLLRRRMQFNLLTVIEVGSIAIATVCAITAAQVGWGYWALVLQVVVMQVVQSVAYWLTCDWRPSRPTAKAEGEPIDHSLRAMFSYGANLTGFRFITRIGMQMDRILVGYISGAAALGFYDVAYRWAYFPFVQIYGPMFDVAVSSLSRAYGNPATYRKYCHWALMSLFALCMPALAFLYVTARDVLLILLGEQWLPAIPIFRLLLVAMYVGSLYRVTKWLYVSSGQTKRQLRWGLVHTPVMIAAVAIGAQWGAYGIAAGYTTGMCTLTIPSVLFCLQVSPLSVRDFLRAVWPAATASIATAVCLFVAQPMLVEAFSNSFARLCVAAAGYGLVYVGIWVLLPGGRQAAMQILGSFADLRKKKGA